MSTTGTGRVQPQHDAPTCAHCQTPAVTPLDLRESLHGFRCSDMWHLFCPACGHDYHEAGDQRVARAWWSAGAYAGAEEVRETEVVEARAAAFAEVAAEAEKLRAESIRYDLSGGYIAERLAKWCRERAS